MHATTRFHFPLITAAGISAIGFALTALPASAETTDTINRTFEVSAGGRLVIDVDVGAIDIRGGSTSGVVVEITRKVDADSSSEEKRILRDHVVSFDQTGDTVRIHARGPRDAGVSWWKALFGNNPRRNYRFSVKVPGNFDVELRTAGGGIDVGTLTGRVQARTSGGGLKFSRITGDIDGRTSGGGITLEQCAGEIDVHTSGGGIKSTAGTGNTHLNTSGGGITVRDHAGDVDASTSGGGITLENISGNVDAHTSGGSIKATLVQAPSADCRLATSGGGVTVAVPANAAITLDAATSGGGAHSELPITIVGEQKRDRLKGAINGGGPLLHLRSSGGSVRVTKAPPSSGSVAVER